MDIRKEIIQEIANSGIASEEEIEDVIKWTFFNINKATTLYDRIEISGLGDLIYNQRKSKHHLATLQASLPTLEGRKLLETEKMIDYINKKDEQISRISETNPKGNS